MERDTRCSKINYGSILEAIKEELKKQDQDTYQEWEGKDFDINHLFGVSLTTEGYNAKLALSHIAAYNGHTEIVSALVKAEGIDVNAASKDGMTPLHLAAFNGHLDTVRVLLAKGADPSLKNKNGDTPRQLAKDKNIIQLLKNAETKQITSKAIKTGVTLGIITALTVGVGCGIAGVWVSILAIVTTAALVVGLVAGGITYAILKPSDKLDKANLQQSSPINQQLDVLYFPLSRVLHLALEYCTTHNSYKLIQPFHRYCIFHNIRCNTTHQ